jgi:AraC-like DNA-binding protein
VTGTLRISAVWQLPALLRELDVDLEAVLAETGMPPETFGRPDNTITYHALEQLLLVCERHSNRDDFGLLIGQRSRLVETGLAGAAARCGKDVGQGLQRLVEQFNLHDGAATMAVVTAGQYTRFVYAIAEHGLTDTRQIQLGAITIAFNVLRDLCGNGWRPAAVTLACRSPANPRACQKFFRAPVRFDSDESALVFERHWLERALPPVDPQERRRIEDEVAAGEIALHRDFPATVRRIVRKQLMFRKCSMDAVAASLGMHRRTLDRQLQRHGVQYGQLVDSVKQNVAQQLLRDTQLQVQQVAESLHFSTAANFATAFRRWTGTTPSEFRRQDARRPVRISRALLRPSSSMTMPTADLVLAGQSPDQNEAL